MIRKATMQDISRIAEIIVFGKRVAYRPTFQNVFVSFNDLQVSKLMEEFHANSTSIDNMLIYDDGILKGVINRRFEGDTVELIAFYVEPFLKGIGIGRKLMEAVISQAKENHIKKIYLWVIRDNLSARKFYEATGFKETSETCLFEGTDKVDICYELRV